MSEFHHGPEVIEHRDGVSVVRDVRSAITYVNGCAPIHEVHDTPAKRADFINKRIVVRSRADATAWFGPQTAGYNIPAALDALFDESSGGTIIVNNVFDPDEHQGDGDAPDPTQVTTAELTGEITHDVATGMKGAYECYARFGFFPKLYLSDRSTTAVMRAEMNIVAHHLHGLALCDLPMGLTKQEAVESRGIGGPVDANTDSARVIFCYPHVEVQDPETDGTRLDPLSTALAGVIIRTDLEQGLNHSPSNREIRRAVGMETDINWYPSDYQSDTNWLNAAGIVTMMRGFATGIRTWGNRSAAFPTSSHVDNFIHARRILDATHEAIIFFKMNYVDRLSDPANVVALEDAINGWLHTKIGRSLNDDRGRSPWFYDARYTFDRTMNTAQEIADGRVHYRLDSHPIGVMERITTHSFIDVNMIRGALGLVA